MAYTGKNCSRWWWWWFMDICSRLGEKGKAFRWFVEEKRWKRDEMRCLCRFARLLHFFLSFFPALWADDQCSPITHVFTRVCVGIVSLFNWSPFSFFLWADLLHFLDDSHARVIREQSSFSTFLRNFKSKLLAPSDLNCDRAPSFSPLRNCVL